MGQCIVSCYTDGGDREDGNIFYSRFLIVEGEKMDHPIFKKLEDGSVKDIGEVTALLKNFGFKVIEPDIYHAEVTG